MSTQDGLNLFAVGSPGIRAAKVLPVAVINVIFGLWAQRRPWRHGK
jgi:hypothetical protein